MKPDKRFIAIVGIATSLVFLGFAFRDLKPAAVVSNIADAAPAWLILSVGVYFVAVSVISLRWQYLLRAVKVVPLRQLIPLVAIGYMGNNVYPFRSGEILRIVLLQRNHAVPITKATTTVVVERVFDGLVMLTFVIVPLLFIDVSSREIHSVALLAAPLFLSALAAFFLVSARPGILRRIITYVCRWLPGRMRAALSQISEDIIAGLEGLRSPADLAGAIISSYLTWAIEASVYWLVSFAFDLNVSYPVMLVAVGAVNLAGLIPASPGQIGVFEFFVATVLIAVGVAETEATAYALVVHAVIWLPITLAGLFFFIREGLHWKAITHAHQLEQEATA